MLTIQCIDSAFVVVHHTLVLYPILHIFESAIIGHVDKRWNALCNNIDRDGLDPTSWGASLVFSRGGNFGSNGRKRYPRALDDEGENYASQQQVVYGAPPAPY